MEKNIEGRTFKLSGIQDYDIVTATLNTFGATIRRVDRKHDNIVIRFDKTIKIFKLKSILKGIDNCRI